MKKYVFAALIAAFAAGANPAFAQSKDPIEVTADHALEWNRAETVFVARGNAVAVQGSMTFKSDVIIASYTDTDQGMVVNTIRGKGTSIVETETATGYGDAALYDLDAGYAELTGVRPRIETETDVITADNKIEYYIHDNKMVATGGVEVKSPDETLTADKVIAFFKKAADGSNQLDTVHAEGNVVITTATEILYGDKADYNVAGDKAVVTGNVRIEKDKNIITGQRAEFDMKTNISTMTSPGDNGRVKGIFYPEEKTE